MEDHPFRAWIIRKEGEQAVKVVMPEQERELRNQGYDRYYIQREDDGGNTVRHGSIFTNRDRYTISFAEWNKANVGLFGEGGSFKVYDEVEKRQVAP